MLIDSKHCQRFQYGIDFIGCFFMVFIFDEVMYKKVDTYLLLCNNVLVRRLLLSG